MLFKLGVRLGIAVFGRRPHIMIADGTDLATVSAYAEAVARIASCELNTQPSLGSAPH